MFGKTQNGLNRRRLQVESLERREVLAGNVMASVVGNVLMLTGDNLDNSVVVFSLGGGKYAVAGNNTTTVNGSANNFVTNRSISHITADLKGGNDALSLTNNAAALENLATDLAMTAVLGVPSTTALQTRISAATTVSSFSLPGNLTVWSRAGNDLVAIVGNVGGSIVADLGGALSNGQNALGIDGSSLASAATVGGSMTVVGGGQADRLHLEDASVRGSLVYTAGGGNDQLQMVDASVRYNVVANLMAGNDSVSMTNTSIGGVLTVLLGDGNDSLTADRLNVRLNATLDAGGGNDTVNLDETSVGNYLFAYLGAGNDSLRVTQSRAKGALVYGGSGTDSLAADAATIAAIDYLFKTQFESETTL